MIDHLHALLTKAMLFTTKDLVVNDQVYARIQTVMFIGTFAGIFTATLSVVLHSYILSIVTLILILPPLAWDRVQFFLITLPDEEEEE